MKPGEASVKAWIEYERTTRGEKGFRNWKRRMRRSMKRVAKGMLRALQGGKDGEA